MTDPAFESALLRGAALLREGAYFEAHEAWEAPWLLEKDPARRLFLQGLIQIAAALHKLVRVRDPASAARLFARGLAKLDACPAAIAGADLAAFREGVRGCAADLARGAFDPAAVPALEVRAAAEGGVIER